MTEIICVLNPIAGRGKAKKKWEVCRQALQRRGINVETLVTSAPGDAAILGKKAIQDGAKTIIVAGGDGTVSEVVEAAVGGEVNIAIAPFGTGNDLARGMQLPFGEQKWADDFPSFQPQKSDLGLVNGRYFANQVGLGFDARAAHKINCGLGFLTGSAAYLAAIASCLWTFEDVDVEIRVDGTILQKKVLLVSFANSPFVGGGLMTVPAADPCDGYLDLFILEKVSRLEFIKAFPLIFNGAHVNHPAVSFYRGRSFSVRAAVEQYVHLDGEIFKGKSLAVHIKPGCVNFLVPSNTN